MHLVTINVVDKEVDVVVINLKVMVVATIMVTMTVRDSLVHNPTAVVAINNEAITITMAINSSKVMATTMVTMATNNRADTISNSRTTKITMVAAMVSNSNKAMAATAIIVVTIINTAETVVVVVINSKAMVEIVEVDTETIEAEEAVVITKLNLT